MAKEKLLIKSGKRKTSIAKAKIVPGKGMIIFNKMNYELLTSFHKLSFDEPLRIAKKYIKNWDFDIIINASGGGREGQIQAARIALAKILIEKTKSEKLKREFEKYDRHLLVADVRRKEAYKPGDSKARAKRQTSYR